MADLSKLVIFYFGNYSEQEGVNHLSRITTTPVRMSSRDMFFRSRNYASFFDELLVEDTQRYSPRSVHTVMVRLWMSRHLQEAERILKQLSAVATRAHIYRYGSGSLALFLATIYVSFHIYGVPQF
jgi:hypothetical protein